MYLDDQDFHSSSGEAPPLRPDSPPPLRLPEYTQTPSESLEINWNEQFQRLIEQTNEDPTQEMFRTAELRRLCHNFAVTAETVSVELLRQLSLPAAQRWPPPVTAQGLSPLSLTAVGGVAGGEKYKTRGLFCKVAVNARQVYPTAAAARKAASLELAALMALSDCRLRRLTVPLAAVTNRFVNLTLNHSIIHSLNHSSHLITE